MEFYDSYTQIIAKGMHIPTEEVSQTPLNITLIDASYSLAFIDYENDTCLGVNYTAADGTERFVVINKRHIIDIAVIYQQDFFEDINNNNDDDDENISTIYQ